MSLELALAALRQANRIDGTRASYKKDSPSEYQAVMAYLDGGPKPTGNLSLMGQGLVGVENVRRGATPPPPPPPPPPPSANALDSFSDIDDNLWDSPFVNRWKRTGMNAYHGYEVSGPPWASTGGPSITEIPRGFRFDCRGEMVAFSPGSKAIMLHDQEHLLKKATCIGSEFDWEAEYVFPRAGNPQGWAALYDVNALLEFVGDSFVANQFGIDGPRNCLYMRTYDVTVNRTRVARATSHPIQWDVPMKVRCHWRFSYGSDGFARFWVDGDQVGNFTGQTMEAGKSYGSFMFGYYSSTSPDRNEILARDIRCKVTPP